jgi:hypothetical protein
VDVMQRRDLFKLVASGAALTTTTLVLGCQREQPPAASFVGPLRKHAMPDTIEPAFAFRPLPQPTK